MSIEQLIETYGPVGPIIGGLIWWGMAERKERIASQKAERTAFEKFTTAINDLTTAIRDGVLR